MPDANLVGQRFRQVGPPRRLWHVERNLGDLTTLPHYRLRAVDDASRKRIVSRAALLDRRRYWREEP